MYNILDADPLASFFSRLGLDDDESTIVENIMREDVFHSTLDWQTKQELIDGAIRAHRLFRQEEAFHRANLRYQKARFRFLLAGGDAPYPPSTPEFKKASVELDAARQEFTQYLSPLNQ